MNNDSNSYENLLEWSREIESFRVGNWKQWPDIDLYMDQVISYLERYLTLLRVDDGEKIITPSIINNNTKDGVLPKPVKKKYSKKLLSTLLIFSTLRQVLPTQDMTSLLTTLGTQEDFSEVHNEFVVSLEQSLGEIARKIRAEITDIDLGDRYTVAMLAMKLAIEADATSLAARKLLATLSLPEEGEKKDEAKDEGKE